MGLNDCDPPRSRQLTHFSRQSRGIAAPTHQDRESSLRAAAHVGVRVRIYPDSDPEGPSKALGRNTRQTRGYFEPKALKFGFPSSFGEPQPVQ
jgi:hypothetical protein